MNEEPIEAVVARVIDRMGAPEEPTQDVRDAWRLAREVERLQRHQDELIEVADAVLEERDEARAEVTRQVEIRKELLTEKDERIERLQAVARAAERVNGSAWADLQPGDLGGEA